MLKGPNDPLWFKQAVIYQLHVRSFSDGNSDGIGDFEGLRKKLPYLKSLGVTAIWLLPFYPSPLKDDGYDIANYYGIHTTYGNINDFRRFLREAHALDLRVIIELIINHTSDQHPWFQRARQSKPGSPWYNYYVWSDTPNKYQEARIIFEDFETSNWAWDPVAKAYYWHRFYSHQPDLNFESPRVQKEVFRVLDFWFNMGVDGLRLDAIPYLFEQEGTSCENLETTHQFIRQLRQHMDNKFSDRVLIAEANQWPEDAVAYFGKGDECHMAFHFPVMPRLFMAIQMEDRFPVIDILEQTPQPPPNCQWVMFLRNHDELTLEMVTDEERDYMYRIYAKDPKARINLGIRRRLAPLLDNDRSKIELMNILLFSLPGTPVIYYGDEIGMGDNYYLGDRNGVRTPMQWSSDRNAGFSSANPQRLYLPVIIDPAYHFEVVNVENQESNPSSLLWWIRHMLLVRKKYEAFGFGSLEFINTDNSKVLAFTRTYNDEIILLIANLSRHAQSAELDMNNYLGYFPIELFNHSYFPKIKEKAYNITLGPYGYYWLSLKPSLTVAHLTGETFIPTIEVGDRWQNILKAPYIEKLEQDVLPNFLKQVRWFERKTATIQSIKIIFIAELGQSKLCFLEVRYTEVDHVDTYMLTFAFTPKLIADQILMDKPSSVMARLKAKNEEGILYDGVYSEELRKALFQLVLHRKRIKFNTQELIAYPGEILYQSIFNNQMDLTSRVINSDHTNTSFIYGTQYFLKLYRKLEEGINPDIEMEKFLSEKAKFSHVPQFAGAIEWHRRDKQPTAIAILETQIANEGTGWDFTLDSLAKFYEHLSMQKEMIVSGASALSDTQNVKLLEGIIEGRFLEATRVLGQRTAEMHLALSLSQQEDRAFRPEPFTTLYQRSMYQTVRNSLHVTFALLRKQIEKMPPETQELAIEVLNHESELLNFYRHLTQVKIQSFRTRIHGDYHLDQVLRTGGNDFCIIDFEGEPLQAINTRRIKRSVLRDVAGMLRSFQYATHKALIVNNTINPDIVPQLENWGHLWYEYITQVFLDAYIPVIKTSPLPLICKETEITEFLLQLFVLDKAIYELQYELNSRPDWVKIPCKGILYHLKNKIKIPFFSINFKG